MDQHDKILLVVIIILSFILSIILGALNAKSQEVKLQVPTQITITMPPSVPEVKLPPPPISPPSISPPSISPPELIKREIPQYNIAQKSLSVGMPSAGIISSQGPVFGETTPVPFTIPSSDKMPIRSTPENIPRGLTIPPHTTTTQNIKRR